MASPPPATDAMKPLPVDYPSIITRPPTTIPYFKKPPGISLFYTLFSRFSDTFVFFVVSLLAYSGIVAATILTQPSLGRTGRFLLMSFSTSVAYRFLFLYFNRIHEWRKSDFARRWFFNRPSVLSKTVGSLVMVACYCVKLWAGVYNPAYALIALLGIVVIVSMSLALRPAFDYRIADGSLGGVVHYVFLAEKDANHTSMVIPSLVAFAVFLIITFRCYFEEKAKQAENPK